MLEKDKVLCEVCGTTNPLDLVPTARDYDDYCQDCPDNNCANCPNGVVRYCFQCTNW